MVSESTDGNEQLSVMRYSPGESVGSILSLTTALQLLEAVSIVLFMWDHALTVHFDIVLHFVICIPITAVSGTGT